MLIRQFYYLSYTKLPFQEIILRIKIIMFKISTFLFSTESTITVEIFPFFSYLGNSDLNYSQSHYLNAGT